ncbi:UPF0016 domain protein [Drechmeria coniospora]|uniref:UPF0016 domain protein n=1 Tax=Drechmeria coniospora TaxID=98403 RepID=A0A151GRW4_DRECN|nr:UPF0016 domain protein [Drechmeria coniospora]KYK59823.1 UPF0016 domain protein [Drechmeria coniospora]
MKLKAKYSPLLLLLPSLTAGLVSRAVAGKGDDTVSVQSSLEPTDGPPVPVKGRLGLPTKDAPVDGKDGKPHLGPFVGNDGAAKDADSKERPPLKDRPEDPTLVDGKKIPESNDGVMFDKNREKPQGFTGTEGGVSEKAKARIAQEGRTGEKAVTHPPSPKEQPPLPHSEEQKLQTDDKSKVKSKDKADDDTDYTGLDVRPTLVPSVSSASSLEHLSANPSEQRPDDLPDTPGDKTRTPPKAVPPPKEKSGKTKGASAESIRKAAGTSDDGIIQPFHSFLLSGTMILVSEIGDKTFLVAALMAMKHDRMVVFSAAFGALLVMTVLSAVLGHAVPTLIPKRLTSFLAAGLFLVFGAKLLREGMQMDPHEGVAAEMREVEQELAEKEKELGRTRRGSISPHALEMGLNGRGTRTKGRLSSPARSPSLSPSRNPSHGSGPLANAFHGIGNLCSFLLSPAWVQTFAMTFLGEWGDRSQIATIAMAAGQDYWWVTLGASCGHAICTGVAVIGGRAIAGRVSLKVVTVGGAVAFLLFAVIYFIEALYA